jgi:hypothetical protein
MRVTDRICEDLESIITRFAFGTQIDYDLQMGIMPTQGPGGQQGPNMIICQFFFFARSPLLGQGDLVAVEVLPLEVTKNAEALEGMVKRCVDQLSNESRALIAPPGTKN